jgi:hypothetical protein
VSALGDDRHPDRGDENGGDENRGDENGAGAPRPGRPALQSVGIALDIIDALARAP